MSEASLCQLASIPKKLSYIDEKTNRYVERILILKDDINETNLKLFFNTIYSMKLDNGYAKSFKTEKDSGCLINCFHKIMASEIINLQPLFSILHEDYKKNWLPVDYAITAFFNMFELVEEQSYPIREYNAILRANETNPLFKNTESEFNKEKQFIEDNTKMMKIIEMKQEKKAYVKTLTK